MTSTRGTHWVISHLICAINSKKKLTLVVILTEHEFLFNQEIANLSTLDDLNMKASHFMVLGGRLIGFLPENFYLDNVENKTKQNKFLSI